MENEKSAPAIGNLMREFRIFLGEFVSTIINLDDGREKQLQQLQYRVAEREKQLHLLQFRFNESEEQLQRLQDRVDSLEKSHHVL